MATVYSLICWGGRTGKSVTASNSSGLIFTLTNHGLRDGAQLQFTATTLPGNVAANTTYYAKSITGDTFAIYTNSALTNRVAWSSAGSAVVAHSKKKIDYLASPPTSWRWGASGSERCYDSLSTFVTARNAATTGFDVEHCEIGESFWDYVSSGFALGVTNAPLTKYSPTVNGIFTSAYHNNILDSGYALYSSYCSTGHYCEIYDVCLRPKDSGNISAILYLNGIGVKIRRCEFYGWVKNGVGLALIDGGVGGDVQYCVFTNLETGIDCLKGIQCVVANNTVVKNTNGITAGFSTTNRFGIWINNVAIGNTTNWAAQPTTLESAANNAGLSTDTPWKTGSNTSVTIATSDFLTWGGATYAATDDFKPAVSSSPQVDSGLEFYGAAAIDLISAEVPNYANGGSEARDIGAYEFDHGYGLRPVAATLTLTGLSSGTDVVVRAAGTSTILDSVDSTTGDWGYTYTTPHSVDIDVIKPGMVIVTFRGLSLTSTSSSIPISQQFDRNYA